ncbi:hypothetical protein MKW92_002293 [Papaver armeniacum]|nr:hypothetical protein MKW92_002293 [Papaver armeniacum]
MRSPRLQELARLRELAENEKDEERKARNERRRALRAQRKVEKHNMEAVVPLRRSTRLTPQPQIPQNLDCDASRKRKGKAVVHDNRMRSPRLQVLARLRELAENEKDEERKARNERRRDLRAQRKVEKHNMEAVVPHYISPMLTLQPQIPQNLDCDASRKRKGKAVVHDNRVCGFSYYFCLLYG